MQSAGRGRARGASVFRPERAHGRNRWGRPHPWESGRAVPQGDPSLRRHPAAAARSEFVGEQPVCARLGFDDRSLLEAGAQVDLAGQDLAGDPVAVGQQVGVGLGQRQDDAVGELDAGRSGIALTEWMTSNTRPSRRRSSSSSASNATLMPLSSAVAQPGSSCRSPWRRRRPRAARRRRGSGRLRVARPRRARARRGRRAGADRARAGSAACAWRSPGAGVELDALNAQLFGDLARVGGRCGRPRT